MERGYRKMLTESGSIERDTKDALFLGDDALTLTDARRINGLGVLLTFFNLGEP
jgi:hypothetical protein